MPDAPVPTTGPHPHDKAWRRRPDALWRRVLGGVLVLGPTEDQPLAVLGPAADLWDLLEEPITFGDAVDELTHRYHAEHGTVADDLAMVIERWRTIGVVEPA